MQTFEQISKSPRKVKVDDLPQSSIIEHYKSKEAKEPTLVKKIINDLEKSINEEKKPINIKPPREEKATKLVSKQQVGNVEKILEEKVRRIETQKKQAEKDLIKDVASRVSEIHAAVSRIDNVLTKSQPEIPASSVGLTKGSFKEVLTGIRDKEESFYVVQSANENQTISESFVEVKSSSIQNISQEPEKETFENVKFVESIIENVLESVENNKNFPRENNYSIEQKTKEEKELFNSEIANQNLNTSKDIQDNYESDFPQKETETEQTFLEEKVNQNNSRSNTEKEFEQVLKSTENGDNFESKTDEDILKNSSFIEEKLEELLVATKENTETNSASDISSILSDFQEDSDELFIATVAETLANQEDVTENTEADIISFNKHLKNLDDFDSHIDEYLLNTSSVLEEDVKGILIESITNFYEHPETTETAKDLENQSNTGQVLVESEEIIETLSTNSNRNNEKLHENLEQKFIINDSPLLNDIKELIEEIESSELENIQVEAFPPESIAEKVVDQQTEGNSLEIQNFLEKTQSEKSSEILQENTEMDANSQLRVLTLNDNEHQEATLYRIEKNWALQFRLGPSLLGRRVAVFCNYPQKGNAFERNVYYELEWTQDSGCEHADDTALYTQIVGKLDGSFHYYFTYENE